jgi:DNA (cytosine-5)-methyltransferase 1
LGKTIEIVGVDKVAQPRYPFKFTQGDALNFIFRHGRDFTHIHASPPCQEHSRTRTLHDAEYEDLLEPTRQMLIQTGRPYIIENVLGAPMKNAIILNGPMFGMQIIRKRKFESNRLLLQPGKGLKKGTIGGKNRTRRNPSFYYIIGGHQTGTLQEWRDAMGIDWMTKDELAEAIPPAYTHWLGLQFFR